MKLSDIMGAMNLAAYAEAGLLIFLLAFAAVALNLLLFRSPQEMAEAAQIPLTPESTDDVDSHIGRAGTPSRRERT